MRITKFAIALAGAALSSLCVCLKAADNPTDQFPASYRQWVHVKSTLIGPPFPQFATEGGIHHIYANDKAMEGLRTGQFPDGSVLVYDLLETTENGGVTSEGKRRRVDVMRKDSKAYPSSGGWWFGRFMGSDQQNEVLTSEHRAACFVCHQKRQPHGFVFSEFRD
jgi:hypothetical protein